jgi:hypothetical protein
LEYPVYGLYFATRSSGNEMKLVYNNIRPNETNAVYAATGKKKRVMIKGDIVDPEVMMSELYYRNSAGHSYADYDINKIKFTVDNTATTTVGGLIPDKLYSIDEIMEYVARNWYGISSGILPSAEGKDKDDASRGESLLERSGGPFKYDTTVYLWNFRWNNQTKKQESYYYACSGPLGDLIDRADWHAPYSAHFMYG